MSVVCEWLLRGLCNLSDVVNIIIALRRDSLSGVSYGTLHGNWLSLFLTNRKSTASGCRGGFIICLLIILAFYLRSVL